ncbi:MULTISPECIES: cold shock domain-containing protein [unclassified Streptomyces]|uniref:cold shock domain-containing protein n=1 Tax=unclassified Streptomyces TaxID=2593676 RepID=UPI0035D998E2
MKWFDPDRGIGLVSQEGTGPDIQAEVSALHGRERYLRPGDEVLFNLTRDSAGLRADNIHRSEEARGHRGPCPSPEAGTVERP